VVVTSAVVTSVSSRVADENSHKVNFSVACSITLNNWRKNLFKLIK